MPKGQRKKTKVALDIGSDSLKVMEVSTSQKPPVVENIGIYELQDTSEEGRLKALLSLLETSNIKAKEVITSLSGSGVVARFVELPFMRDSEVAQSLPFEADKYIPFDVKETILDHVILERNQATKKMKILLVGARRNFVKERMDFLKTAGLVPTIIDIDAFAMFNAFTKSIPREGRDKKTIALLNIGAGSTNVIIGCEETPWMVRDINMGGTNLTQALQEQLGIDPAAARTLKHDPAGRAEEVVNALGAVLQKLAEEIKLSFTYYEDQYGKKIDEAYLSGGSVKLAGLEAVLKELTELDFKQWDPLKPYEVSADISKDTLLKLKSSLAVCSGLALRN